MALGYYLHSLASFHHIRSTLMFFLDKIATGILTIVGGSDLGMAGEVVLGVDVVLGDKIVVEVVVVVVVVEDIVAEVAVDDRERIVFQVE